MVTCGEEHEGKMRCTGKDKKLLALHTEQSWGHYSCELALRETGAINDARFMSQYRNTLPGTYINTPPTPAHHVAESITFRSHVTKGKECTLIFHETNPFNLYNKSTPKHYVRIILSLIKAYSCKSTERAHLVKYLP